MRRQVAPIIAFSGSDGSGKSTQIQRLQDHLDRYEVANVCCWSRGGYTPLFSWAKSVLRRAPGDFLPPAGESKKRDRLLEKRWIRRAWLILSILDLGFLYGVKIRWWRRRGTWVICDRYLLDTRIDFELNFPGEKVDSWWVWQRVVRFCPQPDVHFVMRVPVEESLRRSRQKDEPFPDPPERLAFRLGYYRQKECTEGRIVLDGLRSIDEVFSEVHRALPPFDRKGTDAD
ncbi:MAG: hypothetical protein VX574_00650 [Myxococcota bacterium]|nr:hypothetical protein [Myxococcota bacterium]